MTRFATTRLLLLGVLLGEPKAALASDITTLGFVDTGGVFTRLVVPGALDTFATGINDKGQIVGYYQSNNLNYLGFVYSAGVFSTLNVPGATYTFPYGINDSGEIVGYFVVTPGVSDLQGFVDTGGVFSTLDVPGAIETVPFGINNNGQIVGLQVDSGFLYSAGVFSTLDVPDAIETVPLGINDSDQIVGYFVQQPVITQSFVDTGGVFTTLAAGTSVAFPAGINDSGQIVGSFRNQFAEGSGFVDTGGVFSSVNFPGLTFNSNDLYIGTFPSGINDSGQIVGYVTVPGVPEPSYLIPLCFGMVILAFALRGRISDKRQSD